MIQVNQQRYIYHKKYRDKAQSLINTIYVEQLREVHLSKNDIEVQIVPENQTVFLYREMLRALRVIFLTKKKISAVCANKFWFA